MKKHILFLAALCMSSLMMLAATVTPPADIPAYWASVDGKSDATLWSAVSAQRFVFRVPQDRCVSCGLGR